MPSEPSRYFVPSKEKVVTKEELKLLSRKSQIEAMRNWFDSGYDSPDDLPYDSSEGGYQWIWGGPYDALEELQSEFGDTIDEEIIEELASELYDISSEWSGKPQYDDYDDYLVELMERGDPYMTLVSSLVDIENAAKISPSEKERRILHKLLFANVTMALETFLNDLFMQTIFKNEKYIEDFVFKTPHFQVTQIKLSEIFERYRKIDSDVKAYIRKHNWHMLSQSAMMYKRAFGIVFPDVPTAISNGIRDRHDIVHRNGKGEDGRDGSWGLSEILTLKEAVLNFATEIRDQLRALEKDAPDPIPF